MVYHVKVEIKYPALVWSLSDFDPVDFCLLYSLSIDWLPETVKLKQVNAISIDTFELFSYSNDEG